MSAASRERLERLLPGTPVREPAEVFEAADLVLLTVPDDVLGGLVAGLAATVARRWRAASSRTPAAATVSPCWSPRPARAPCRSPCTR